MARGLPFLQFYLADEQGSCEDCGLTVEFLSVVGSAAATAALLSGSADATFSLPEGAVTATAAAAPLQMIGATVDGRGEALQCLPGALAEGPVDVAEDVDDAVTIGAEAPGSSEEQTRIQCGEHAARAQNVANPTNAEDLLDRQFTD